MPTITEMQTRIGLARSESARLSDYLGNLAPAAWEHSTACDRWQVTDVVAHLVWIGEFYSIFIARALRDDLSPPPVGPGCNSSRPAVELGEEHRVRAGAWETDARRADVTCVWTVGIQVI